MFDDDECECGNNCPPCEECEMPECECECDKNKENESDEEEMDW